MQPRHSCLPQRESVNRSEPGTALLTHERHDTAGLTLARGDSRSLARMSTGKNANVSRVSGSRSKKSGNFACAAIFRPLDNFARQTPSIHVRTGGRGRAADPSLIHTTLALYLADSSPSECTGKLLSAYRTQRKPSPSSSSPTSSDFPDLIYISVRAECPKIRLLSRCVHAGRREGRGSGPAAHLEAGTRWVS